MGLPKHVTVAPDVLFREVEGEMVLLNLKNESYYGLDEIGARMWQLLNAHDSVEGAMKQILAEYEVEESRLRPDLIELINNLVEAGLIIVDGED